MIYLSVCFSQVTFIPYLIIHNPSFIDKSSNPASMGFISMTSNRKQTEHCSARLYCFSRLTLLKCQRAWHVTWVLNFKTEQQHYVFELYYPEHFYFKTYLSERNPLMILDFKAFWIANIALCLPRALQKIKKRSSNSHSSFDWGIQTVTCHSHQGKWSC